MEYYNRKLKEDTKIKKFLFLLILTISAFQIKFLEKELVIKQNLDDEESVVKCDIKDAFAKI